MGRLEGPGHPPRPRGRARPALAAEVFPDEVSPSPNALDIHVGRLRRKLTPDGPPPQHAARRWLPARPVSRETRRSSLVGRLLLAQIVPLALLAAALTVAGAPGGAGRGQGLSDRLLAGSAASIVARIGARDGQAEVALPPWALGLLDSPERDAVSLRRTPGTKAGHGLRRPAASLRPRAERD
ncbi:sensor histidine kinase N-terminal domain-containing protein [Caulobacter segnis]